MEAEAQTGRDSSEPRKQHARKDTLVRRWGVFTDCGEELLGEAGEATSSDLFLGE